MIIIKAVMSILTIAGTVGGVIEGGKFLKRIKDKYKVVRTEDLEDLEKAADNAGLTEEDIML